MDEEITRYPLWSNFAAFNIFSRTTISTNDEIIVSAHKYNVTKRFFLLFFKKKKKIESTKESMDLDPICIVTELSCYQRIHDSFGKNLHGNSLRRSYMARFEVNCVHLQSSTPLASGLPFSFNQVCLSSVSSGRTWASEKRVLSF